jgi:hypothetical protein
MTLASSKHLTAHVAWSFLEAIDLQVRIAQCRALQELDQAALVAHLPRTLLGRDDDQRLPAATRDRPVL